MFMACKYISPFKYQDIYTKKYKEEKAKEQIIYNEQEPVYNKPKKPVYLPGERLLLKLRNKEKKDLEKNQINKSIENVLSILL